MAQKKITDLTLRSDFDETCNIPVDDSTQTWRTTGQQVLDFIEDNIDISAIQAVKAWLICGVVGDITASYNVSSLTDQGVGQVRPFWTVPFNSGNYVVLAVPQNDSSMSARIHDAIPPSSTDAVVDVSDTVTGLNTDPVGYHICAIGDQ